MRRSDAKQYVLDQDSGKYDYIGRRYRVMADEADFRRLKRLGMAASMALVAIFVACGLFPFGGMRSNYVVLPYVLLILPVAWLLSRQIRLWNKRMELTEAGNRLLINIRWSSLAAGALGALAALGQIVHSVRNGLSQGDAAFIALMLACLPLGALVFWMARKCPTEPLLIDDLPEAEDEEIPEEEQPIQ